MLCDCECEREGAMYEVKSPECNGVGTLKCGICECYDGFFGKRCECSPHQEMTGFDKHFQSCRPDNTSLVDCSGRGTCACGQCECEERENRDELISGHFCECDNFSCDRDQGHLCSNHGTCECGQCVCHAGWTSPSCNCRSSNETCIAPGTTNGLLCSGHVRLVITIKENLPYFMNLIYIHLLLFRETAYAVNVSVTKKAVQGTRANIVTNARRVRVGAKS